MLKTVKNIQIISIDYKERSISLRHKYNISLIPCRSASLMELIRVLGENHRQGVIQWQP